VLSFISDINGRIGSLSIEQSNDVDGSTSSSDGDYDYDYDDDYDYYFDYDFDMDGEGGDYDDDSFEYYDPDAVTYDADGAQAADVQAVAEGFSCDASKPLIRCNDTELDARHGQNCSYAITLYLIYETEYTQNSF